MIWSDFEFVIHLACIIKTRILDIIWPCLLIIMIMTWLFSGMLFICALVFVYRLLLLICPNLLAPKSEFWLLISSITSVYFFIVREISQLGSTSCAKHGFSQWLPAISNRSLKFSCVSSEFFSNCKVSFPLPLEFLVFTCDARDPIN